MNKKGVSNIVAYVLLISVVIALAVVVYAGLKVFVVPVEVEECPVGTEVIINSYSCGGGSLSLVLKNSGTFGVDGYEVKVNDRNASYGFHDLGGENVSIAPGEKHNSVNFDYGALSLGGIETIEVKPIVYDEGKIYCRVYVAQGIGCV